MGLVTVTEQKKLHNDLVDYWIGIMHHTGWKQQHFVIQSLHAATTRRVVTFLTSCTSRISSYDGSYDVDFPQKSKSGINHGIKK